MGFLPVVRLRVFADTYVRTHVCLVCRYSHAPTQCSRRRSPRFPSCYCARVLGKKVPSWMARSLVCEAGDVPVTAGLAGEPWPRGHASDRWALLAGTHISVPRRGSDSVAVGVWRSPLSLRGSCSQPSLWKRAASIMYTAFY